jgi:hypothetical protein
VLKSKISIFQIKYLPEICDKRIRNTLIFTGKIYEMGFFAANRENPLEKLYSTPIFTGAITGPAQPMAFG